MSNKILHQTSWAKSAGGLPIELFCSEPFSERNSSAGKSKLKPILFIGGVHGDEPEGVRLAQDLLDWLQKNHRNQWLLIPCLNLDGFKNKARTNAHGVDLNRNFPCRDWSSECKSPRYFPGPHPASEPEVQALVKLIDEAQPQLIVHFHSWEACVVYTGPSGKEYAELIGRDTGYRISEDIGYPTPGSLGQYGWYEKLIPVICVEAQEGSPLEAVWPTFGAGLQRLIDKAQNGYG